METNVKYTIVGTFVITSLAFIILAIIWLASGFTTEKYKIYKIYMQESVSGLSLESPVEFNGVNVGNIKRIKINKENPQLVVLLIKVKKSTPVTKGTVATLSIRGITGITFIALQDYGTNTTLLEATEDDPYPVIKTVPSILVRLDTLLSNLTKNFRQFSDSIQALLSKENLHSIKSILQSSQNTLKSIEAQTLPATTTAINNFSNMTQSMSELSAEIKQNPAVLIRGKEQRPLGPGEK